MLGNTLEPDAPVFTWYISPSVILVTKNIDRMIGFLLRSPPAPPTWTCTQCGIIMTICMAIDYDFINSESRPQVKGEQQDLMGS